MTKVLNDKGIEKIDIEANDGDDQALAFIKNRGGSINHTYRTPLLMRNYLKP